MKLSNEKKTAVILFNLGGPDKLSSVKPFLFNLFNDKAIINLPQPFRFLLAKLISGRRNKKSQNIYAQIGGKSPIVDITEAQAYALEKELSFFGNFKVFVSMRYWHPMAKKVVQDVFNYAPDEIILLPLYPQFSSTTSASSFKDFLQKFNVEQEKRRTQIAVKQICCYFAEPQFASAHAKLILQAITKYKNNLHNLRFLFSAHGLPQKLINQGDPYVFQVEKSVEFITQNLEQELQQTLPMSTKLDIKVCYQSKVGPLQWTGPSLDHEIRRAALDNKIAVVIPIAFVSEHSETLVELDIDYKNLAKELKMPDYIRVEALNVNHNFIQLLVEMCKKVSTSDRNNDGVTNFAGCSKTRLCSQKFVMCLNDCANK